MLFRRVCVDVSLLAGRPGDYPTRAVQGTTFMAK